MQNEEINCIKDLQALQKWSKFAYWMLNNKFKASLPSAFLVTPTDPHFNQMGEEFNVYPGEEEHYHNHNYKEQKITSSRQNDDNPLKLEVKKTRKYSSSIEWTKTLNPPDINTAEKHAHVSAWHITLNHISLDKLLQIAKTNYLSELFNARITDDMVLKCAAWARRKYR